MTGTIIKVILRVCYWLASRHRLVGIRDWLASSIAIAALGIFLAVPHASEAISAAKVSQWAGFGLSFSIIILILLLCWIPISYVFKLRRIGITDADYSVATGIDYSAALQSAKNGFSFGGVSGSKLKEREGDFRKALKGAIQHGGRIRMLLLDPRSKAFSSLERIDSTTGYQAKASGNQEFFKSFEQRDPDNFEMRYYAADRVEHMMPFRIFMTADDCLLSPFVQGTGEQDQGRGLPQLRITSKAFPSANEPTLFTAFSRYFDVNWSSASQLNKE